MPAHINLPRGLLHRHAGGLMTLLRLADLAVVGIAAWLAYLWRFEDRGFDRESALLVLLAVLLAALVFPAADLYHEWRGRSRLGELRQVLGAWAVLLALLLLYLYFSKQAVLVSRIWIGVWFVSGASMTMMLRLVMREGLRGLRKEDTTRAACCCLEIRIATVKSANTFPDIPIQVTASLRWSPFHA